MIEITNLNDLRNQTITTETVYVKGYDTSGDEGLWNSRISNIIINGFKGHGIYLEGGDLNSNYLLPNQFNIFENVRVFKNSDFSHALYMTGQNGQFTFLNCEFDGFKKNGDYSKGQNIRISNSGGLTSGVVSFINCTCQDADYGMYFDYAENITIDNCWFENLGVAITILSNTVDIVNQASSRSINVLNSRFANAAGFGGLNAPNNIKAGQCISVNNSFANVYNNYVVVSEPYGVHYNNNSSFLSASNNSNCVINIGNNEFQEPKLGKTFGVMQTVNVNNYTINCYGNKLVFVNGSQSIIKTITSSINAGEFLNIRANGGSIAFENTDNIFFLTNNQNQSFILNNGENATFVKVDNIVGNNYETYQLISVLKTLT